MTSESPSQYLEPRSVALDQCQKYVPKSLIYEIEDANKYKLLRRETSDSDHDTARILERLERFSIASLFIQRDEAIEKFKMKLCFKSEQDASTTPESYIAMSYRCTTPLGDTLLRDKMAPPVAPEIFEAVSALMLPGEGLWFDTGCIDQEDDSERATAIGVMDGVYKNARQVIVVLWDVQLDSQEADLLRRARIPFAEACEQSAIAYPHYRGTGLPPWYTGIESLDIFKHPASVSLGLKFMRSEYWERAFCSQEFHVARRVVFLIPCSSAQPEEHFDYWTVDATFIGELFVPKGHVVQTFKDMQGLGPAVEAALLRDSVMLPVLLRKALRMVEEGAMPD